MSYFSKILFGVDLEEEQARQDALDAALREQNNIDLKAGRISQDVYDQSMRQIADSAINVQAEVSDAFRSGMAEGAAGIAGAVKNTTNMLVPKEIWVIAGLIAAIWAFTVFRK